MTKKRIVSKVSDKEKVRKALEFYESNDMSVETIKAGKKYLVIDWANNSVFQYSEKEMTEIYDSGLPGEEEE